MGDEIDQHGKQHGGIVAAHGRGHILGAIQAARQQRGGVLRSMQENQHPQVARAEVDGRKQHAQRARKHALHQHAKGSAGQDVGQVRPAEEKPGQQAGFPDARTAGAEVLQQGLGDDAPEEKFLRHAHREHPDEIPRDLPAGAQGPVGRHPEQQLAVEGVADHGKGEHAHQDAIEKAAAPAAEQPQPVGLL